GGADDAIIRAALPTVHLPGVDAARSRVRNAEREVGILVGPTRLHRGRTIHLYRTDERSRCHERGTPSRVHIRVPAHFSHRLTVERVARAKRRDRGREQENLGTAHITLRKTKQESAGRKVRCRGGNASLPY